MHVLRLSLPLEHAPDQIASRPFDTLRVIEVPTVKPALPVVPTITLMPGGSESTHSPLRPIAVTVSVAVSPGGLTVSTAEAVRPLYVAETVTAVDVLTTDVDAVTFALTAPAGTVTLGGTVTTEALTPRPRPVPPKRIAGSVRRRLETQGSRSCAGRALGPENTSASPCRRALVEQRPVLARGRKVAPGWLKRPTAPRVNLLTAWGIGPALSVREL